MKPFGITGILKVYTHCMQQYLLELRADLFRSSAQGSCKFCVNGTSSAQRFYILRVLYNVSLVNSC